MHNRIIEIIGKHLKSQMVQDKFVHIMVTQIDYAIVTHKVTAKMIKLSDSFPHVAPMGFQKIVKKDSTRQNGRNNSDKTVQYNDLIDNKVIDKCFGQEIEFMSQSQFSTSRITRQLAIQMQQAIEMQQQQQRR